MGTSLSKCQALSQLRQTSDTSDRALHQLPSTLLSGSIGQRRDWLLDLREPLPLPPHHSPARCPQSQHRRQYLSRPHLHNHHIHHRHPRRHSHHRRFRQPAFWPFSSFLPLLASSFMRTLVAWSLDQMLHFLPTFSSRSHAFWLREKNLNVHLCLRLPIPSHLLMIRSH